MSSITTITGMFTKKAVIAWALIAGLLLAVALLPKASATENSVVGLEASKSVVAIDPASESSFLGESFTTIAGAIFSKDLALVSLASIEVEHARAQFHFVYPHQCAFYFLLLAVVILKDRLRIDSIQ